MNSQAKMLNSVILSHCPALDSRSIHDLAGITIVDRVDDLINGFPLARSCITVQED